MITAKILENGRSQAVRLPREWRFSGRKIWKDQSRAGEVGEGDWPDGGGLDEGLRSVP